MNLFSFRGMIFLACTGAAALWFKPWEHTKAAGAGVVTGKTVDSDGRGIPGASIILRDKQGVVVGRAESGSNGEFVFDNCKPGRYRVAAVQPAYGGGERNIYVDSHIHADATIRLVTEMTGVGHR